MKPPFIRQIGRLLEERLADQPRQLQILVGPRQVGKTTLARQVLSGRPGTSFHLVAVDAPPEAEHNWLAAPAVGIDGGRPDEKWLGHHWRLAQERADRWRKSQPANQALPFVLVVDEIQLIPDSSAAIKGLWDGTLARGTPMHVLLLDSAPLLIQKGLTESLAGRYELIRMTHWSFEEMNEAFGFSLDQYLYFGGYPGSAPLIEAESRWRSYVRNALIEPNIQKDILALARVDKPALLRQLFELGCAYSAQILSLDKVRGQLGGHTETLAHHLTLLSQAGLIGGLHKYAGQVVRQRSSPPKFQVHNNALMTLSETYDFESARQDRSHWGRLVESAIGAHLINTADPVDTRIHYWRERSLEVDFVIEHRGQLAAIEVKSTSRVRSQAGLDEFRRLHPGALTLNVGTDRLPLGEFLSRPAAWWLEQKD